MAIAFLTGAGDQGGAHTSPLSTSLDCTSATLLIAGVWSVGDVCTGATYNSVAMTKIGSSFQYNTGEYLAIFYLVSPTTGSNTLAATLSAPATSALRGICFSGTATTGIPDSSHTDSAASGDASGTTTSVADNCIGVLFARFEGGNPSAKTNMTSSVAMGETSGSFAIIGYSALKTPAGSLNMVATSTNTAAPWGSIILSLAPPAPPGPANVKTWDGVAIASIKTFEGVTKSSVKTVIGVN